MRTVRTVPQMAVIAVPGGGQRARILRTPDDSADAAVINRQQQPLKTKALRIFAPWRLNCLLVHGDC
jgi:hypothetical protein